MLQFLRLQDFILVDYAEIPFSKGLNVITGESGSGKSVLLKALRLLSGIRSDTSLIRKGCKECVIEAVFTIPPTSPILPLLEEEKIPFKGEELTLKRIISQEGKNASYIQGIFCKNTLLKTITPHLFEIVDQHASLTLFREEQQLENLDRYAQLHQLLGDYRSHFQQLQRLTRKKELFLSNSDERQAKLFWYQEQQKELLEASLSEQEEQDLENEYKVLSHAQELSDGTSQISSLLSGEDGGLLSPLKQAIKQLQSLVSLDSQLQGELESLSSASAELQEAARSLDRYAQRVDINPYRMQEVEDRLHTYAKLQKKYGKSTEELLLHLEHLQEQIESIGGSEDTIEELEKELATVKQTTLFLAETITEKRKAAAETFCKEATTILHTLEMPHAELAFTLDKTSLSSSGQDHFSLELKANLGELFAPLSSCASGGEMARIALAIKRILSATDSAALMVFDEIDAGIGGKTASTVADRLHEIAEKHQIVLISHFPQVAKRADHHIRMYKEAKEERTFTLIEVLDQAGRERELRRMVGEEVEIVV